MKRARAIFDAARAAKNQGDVARAVGLMTKGLTDYTHADAAADGPTGLVLRGRLLHLAVQLNLLRHRLNEAERAARTALVLFEEAGDSRRQRMAWEDLGSVALVRHHPADAIRLFTQALSLAENPRVRARARVNLALAHQQRGHLIAADRELMRAAELFAAEGQEHERLVTLLNAAMGSSSFDNRAGLQKTLQAIRGAGMVSRHPELHARYLMLRGIEANLSGNAELATRLLRKALYVNDEELQSDDLSAEIRTVLASVIVRRGDRPGRAVTICREILAELPEDAEPPRRIGVFRVLAWALHARGEHEAATAAFLEAEALLDAERTVLAGFRLLIDRATMLLEAPGPVPRNRIVALLRRARHYADRIDVSACGLEVSLVGVELLSRTMPEEALVAIQGVEEQLNEQIAAGPSLQSDLLQRFVERIEEARARALKTQAENLVDDAEAVGAILRAMQSENVREQLHELLGTMISRLAADRGLLALRAPTISVASALGFAEGEAEARAEQLLDPFPTTPAVVPGSAGRSALVFPIRSGAVAVGVLSVERELGATEQPFTAADLKTFALLANGLAALAQLPPAPALRVRAPLVGITRHHKMVTRSAEMMRILDAIDVVKDTDLPVLILGESGTGKELVARALHDGGPRAKGSFVAINCAAMPRELLEAELFGYARGAFTGAQRDKRGLFVEADGGTLFLDEIGEMPADIQAKLLRAIEHQTVTPVGSTRPIRVDFRIVAATNARIDHVVQSGSFRKDLYYRLNAYQVSLPPLRERLSDVDALIEHFLASPELQGKGVEFELSAEARRALHRHSWPGNIRELRNVIMTAAAFAVHNEGRIDLDSLPERIREPETPVRLEEGLLARLFSSVESAGYHRVMEDVERYLLTEALDRSSGNRRAAARAIALKESSIRTKLKRLGLDSRQPR